MSRRPVIKTPKVVKDDSSTDLCFFTLIGDIKPNEIIECLISTPNGSITTLYCRMEHEFSIRSVMKQLKLASNDKIEIKKLRIIGESWSTSIPYMGTTNLNLI